MTNHQMNSLFLGNQPRIVLWGDGLGVQTALRAMRGQRPVAVVAASNRPGQLQQVRQLAAKAGTPLMVQPLRKHAVDFRRFTTRLRALDADLYLVNSYSMILDAQWLSWPRLGAFNVHAGLLPEYRGANVLNWAIINGESMTGVTLHELDAGIDTGPVVFQRRVPIAFDDTAVTLRHKLTHTAETLISQLISWDWRRPLPRTEQDERRARHWPRRRPKDGQIDWAWPARQIYDLIRALVAPWPGAYFVDPSGRKVVLDRFVSFEEVELLRAQYGASYAKADCGHPPA